MTHQKNNVQRPEPLSRPAYTAGLTFSLLMVTLVSGCTSLIRPSGIPASRIPQGLLNAERKDDFEDISMLRLRQDPPEFYAIGPGDVIGFYARNLFQNDNELPPVHYPEDSSQPPAVGVPVPVREDGTLTLPFIEPIRIEGLSLVEATELVRRAYTESDAKPILKEGSQISLTMIRRRTVKVLVVREESGGAADITKRGTGHVVDLPAYENDVLHALSETGGLPGLDAKNEVLIYRGLFEDGLNYDQLISQAELDACDSQDDCFCDESPNQNPPNLTRIPLRYNPINPPRFTQEDILLSEGDIVIIKSRDRETFTTGGILSGGEFPLPRDKDLDVLGAIAMAGGPLGNGATGISAIGSGGRGGGGSFGGGGGGGGGFLQPTEVLIVRELPCGDQITIKVDINRALQNPSERVLIQPNDFVMLRFKIGEELVNTALSLIQFNFLLGGFNGGGF